MNHRIRRVAATGVMVLALLALSASGCAGPGGRMAQASHHFKAERYRRALAEYRAVVANHPRSREAPHAQLMVGVCYGWLAGALRDRALLLKEAHAYRELIRRYPKSMRVADANLYLAQIHSGHVTLPGTKVDCARAIPLYRKAMAASRRRWIKAQALGRIGQCYAHDGKHSRALASYREVIRRFDGTPWSIEVKLLAGTVLFSQKRFAAALRMFTGYRAQSRNARSAATTLLMLGLTNGWLAAKHQKFQLLQASAKAFLTLIRLHPRSPRLADALLYLGQIHSGDTGVRTAQRDCKKALPIYRRAIRVTRRNWIKAQALGRIGQCQSRQGNKVAARATYRTVFEKYPKTPWARIAKQLHDALDTASP